MDILSVLCTWFDSCSIQVEARVWKRHICKNEQKPELEPESWKKKNAGATLMKNSSSGAGAMLMKWRAPDPGAVPFLRRLRSPKIIHTVAGHINDPEEKFNG